jgi:hypothetical protein
MGANCLIFDDCLISGAPIERTKRGLNACASDASAIPPPPAPVLGEFGNLSSPEIREGGYAPEMGGFAVERFSPGHPAAIVTMNRNIAELEPKIREFQGAVDSIEKEFREKLDKLLTPVQRKRLASNRGRRSPRNC